MKPRDLLEYVPARMAEAALGALPAGPADRLGLAAGSGAWRLGTRRATVERQIAASFPSRAPQWVDQITRACYRHFGREIAAIARIGRYGGQHLLPRVADGDVAVALHREVTGGGGAIIVTGHVGNWEAAGAFLAAAGLPMAAVVKRQRNPAFNDRMLETRRRSGVEPIYMQDARTRIPEALRAGKTVALVADQDAGERGLFVPFLGRDASTFRGPARLALSQDVPLFFGAAVRVGSGYGWVLEEIQRPDPGANAEREFTRRWVGRLEVQVRLRPEQYFWFHRRWKTRPTGTTAGD
ncbi:MAG: lysophospholipid acyltransferase family protein [Gemmatimonadetes bacterium]|nr:lysophospholipid acyltransferase family protein [Gemmatimonadota bacterium]